MTITTDPAITLGDYLVDLINDQTWEPSGGPALTFTARRLYEVPGYEPTDSTLRVDLVIQEKEPSELVDRGGTLERSFDVAIGIQKIVSDKTSVSEVDDLRNFVTTLLAFFKIEEEHDIGGDGQKARCSSKKQSVPYHPQELDENSRFFALLDFEFVGWFAS